MDDDVKASLTDGGDTWSCPVCGHENQPEDSPAGEFCEACSSPRDPEPL